MDEKRLELFVLGLLADDELTEDEIEWLEDAVREAVINKLMYNATHWMH